MRLVCPNCEAKYEVPDDAVPDTGRDVQCTNCGHSWYQMRGRTGAAPLVAPAADAPAAVERPAPPIPAPEAVAAAQISPADETAEVDAVETVEAVLDAGEEAVIEAIPHESAPFEEMPLPEAATGQIPEDVTDDQVLAEAETVSLHDAKPIAEVAAFADPEPVVDFDPADEPEPEVDVIASLDSDTEPGQMPEPSPVSEFAAAPEAPEAADETIADLVAAKVTPEAVAAGAVGAAAVAASVADADDTPAPASNYAVDDSVLAILREEAEREANARRAEALESQTDLGIDAAMPRKAVALAAEAEVKPSARRDLLPDVEEINSTLRPSEIQAEADGAPDFVAPPPEAPRGFRSGFLSLMTIAILAAALYLVAPRLAVMVPSLAGPLESYVSVIDSLRLGLDGMMRSATVAISDG